MLCTSMTDSKLHGALTCAVLPMMISGASAPCAVDAVAPPTLVTAANRPRESAPLLGVLLELVGGPRRRRVTCTAGVGEGSAARIPRSSLKMTANEGLRRGWAAGVVVMPVAA
jgi:hypothetical protein